MEYHNSNQTGSYFGFFRTSFALHEGFAMQSPTDFGVEGQSASDGKGGIYTQAALKIRLESAGFASPHRRSRRCRSPSGRFATETHNIMCRRRMIVTVAYTLKPVPKPPSGLKRTTSVHSNTWTIDEGCLPVTSLETLVPCAK